MSVAATDDWTVTVPEGTRGPWKVERFTVPENDLSQFIAAFKYGRSVPAGTYTRLTRAGEVVMSDTPDEIRDHYALRGAAGRLLVHGLGLGMAVGFLLRQPGVTSIDVVELDPDVIALVGPHYWDPRLQIHRGDAYTFRFPNHEERSWDFAWHDIWDNICEDNLDGMKRLHRRYGGKVKQQFSWCRSRCERNRGK